MALQLGFSASVHREFIEKTTDRHNLAVCYPASGKVVSFPDPSY